MISLIKFLKKNKVRYAKRQEFVYLSYVTLKNIKIKSSKNLIGENNRLIHDLLAERYLTYYNEVKKLDNVGNRSISYFETKRKRDNFFNLTNNNDRLVGLFNKKSNNNLTLNEKYLRKNILEERLEDIKGRKVSSRIVNPHYFFSTNYIEKSSLPQIRHWTSSAYSFIKSEKTGNNYLDIYTSQLIKLFFRIKYIKKQDIWNIQLLDGFKFVPDFSFFNNINTVINYTTRRTISATKDLTAFSPLVITLKWVKEQFKEIIQFSNIGDKRKAGAFSGYLPKKIYYIRKLRRILLGKPLFKHTSFNLIIDLFLFNNKTYKYRMIRNLILRRTTYKYMYSMYADYQTKIQETINRPRFFYINIINPGLFNHYKRIVSYYGALIRRKPLGIYLFLSLLKMRIIKKQSRQFIYNKFIHNNKNVLKEESSISSNNSTNTTQSGGITQVKTRLYGNSIKPEKNRRNKERSISSILKTKIKYHSELYHLDKKLVGLDNSKLKIDTKIKAKKNVGNFKSEEFKYNNYISESEREKNKELDLNSLSVLNIDNLDNHTINSQDNKKKKSRSSGFVQKNRKQKLALNFKEYPSDDFMFNPRNLNMNPKFYYNKLKKMEKIKNDIMYSNDSNMESYNNEDISLENNNMESYNNNMELYNNEDISLENNNMELNKNENLSLENNNINKYSLNNLNLASEVESVIVKDKDETLLKDSGTDKAYESNNITNYKNSDAELLDIFYSTVSFYVNSEGSNLKKPHKNNQLSTSIDVGLVINKNNNNIKDEIKYKNEENNKKNHMLYSIERSKEIKTKIKQKSISSKKLWKKFDKTTVRFLSKYINLRKGIRFEDHNFNFVYDKVKNVRKFGNIWYLMYFLSVIEREFHNVSKDVLLSKTEQYIPSSGNNNTYLTDREGLDDNSTYTFVYNKGKVKVQFWPSLYPNDREDSIDLKRGYNEKIFKPYYRSMIPFLFLKYYNTFISYLGCFNVFSNLEKIYIDRNIGENNQNEYPVIYNFVSVKILLDLLHYNYRSLLIFKPKYYYLNKLRLYETKFKKLNINTWKVGIRYIRKLRKTPLSFWYRYHKIASHYYGRVVQNAELDTRRKIFVPFVLYFEDILFSIYGKWAIIRLWPLKKFFLSSYILAGRVILLITWRNKQQVKKSNFIRITNRLIAGVRTLQIKRAYDEYMANISRWPAKLINIMKDGKDAHHLNYNTLEFFVRKEDRTHSLNTFVLNNNNLSLILAPSSDYITIVNNSLNRMRKFLGNNIRRNIINKNQLGFYWLRPLKHYIRKLTRKFDITGVKFKMTGRAGIRRNNLRSMHKASFYGSFISPYHYTVKLLKPQSISLPRTRGYLRSNIDYAFGVSKSKNGSISFKVWLASLFSSDIHELLLYLVQIKDLYTQLVNRYYLVNYYMDKNNKRFQKSIWRKPGNVSMLLPKYKNITKQYKKKLKLGK